MKKILIVGLITIIFAFLAVGIWSSKQQTQTTSSTAAVADQSPLIAAPPATHNHEAMNHVPAHYEAAPPLNTLRGTLAPELFTGNVESRLSRG